ncbi:MAG TPA: hypothetical protein VIF14_18810 [Alphaproteobacteria bacterium]|jgi:hypothetical protein
MRKSAFMAFLTGAALALPAAAQALPLAGPQLVQSIRNGEFRGYTRTSRGFENQIWHFLPDGRIRAVAESRKTVWPTQDYRQEWQDIGAWRIEGDRVCVAFQGLNRNLNGCYAVDVRQGKHIRLVGPYVWEGTLEGYE